jgi:hypothetical protein
MACHHSRTDNEQLLMDLDFTETFCHPRTAYNVGTEDIRPGRGEAKAGDSGVLKRSGNCWSDLGLIINGTHAQKILIPAPAAKPAAAAMRKISSQSENTRVHRAQYLGFTQLLSYFMSSLLHFMLRTKCRLPARETPVPSPNLNCPLNQRLTDSPGWLSFPDLSNLPSAYTPS